MASDESRRQMKPVSIDRVEVADSFWGPRMATNREVTLKAEYRHLRQTGRIDAFELDWQPGAEPRPHQFWDSDVAKWLEAASYSLKTHPDEELQGYVDEAIGKIVGAQQPDGYINVYFTVVEPDKRWQNLRDMHELYAAGHLMEAAVAHHDATGSRTLLDAMTTYADYIASVFGDGPGKRFGTPGHEEIELALVKLYEATGDEEYVRLSSFFLNQRGQSPSVFDRERDEPEMTQQQRSYLQDHLPVREQTTAEGHSVRAMYLYSGMADVYAETGDETLLRACERLWENVTRKRMYITGGIGSTSEGERFTEDYDLPNETAYAETCAAIGLVFWAHRMLQLTADGRYADVMERALYNGAISGVSLDGERFFYENPLESRGDHHRQEWFGCACCPPNIARLIASLGTYIYSESDEGAYIHLYVNGSGRMDIGGQAVTVRQETDYPWEGTVGITVEPETAAEFALHLRVPDWCEDPRVEVDGNVVPLDDSMRSGYVRVEREWTGQERVVLRMPMPVRKVYAHPAVRADAGCFALQRGPIVYCLEEADNIDGLHRITVAEDADPVAEHHDDVLGGVTVIRGRGLADDASDWRDTLYRALPPRSEQVDITAVPYCTWDNREPGQMRVWLRAE